MERPRVRLTIGVIMVAIALIAVALVVLPEPVLRIRVPNQSSAAVTLPDGRIARPLPTTEISITRFGFLLMAAVLVVVARAAMWLVGCSRSWARRSTGRELPEPE